MSVVTKDTIQPSSGQALTIKDEGGTASITVATNGEATFAENIKITANKGIDFSAYATSGNPSSNLLSDYEQGTFTCKINTGGSERGTASSFYTKIGNICNCVIWFGVLTDGTSGDVTFTGAWPFAPKYDFGLIAVGPMRGFTNNYQTLFIGGYENSTTFYAGSIGQAINSNRMNQNMSAFTKPATASNCGLGFSGSYITYT